MAKFNYNFFQYFEASKRSIIAQPLNLGGITSSGGGIGGPPGGFIGQLPQAQVAYDWDEFANVGFVQPGAVNPSGVVVSASLLDNLNHIRYRLEQLESGAVTIHDDDILVASGVQVLDFKGDFVEAVDVGGNQVEVTVSGKKTFTDLDDTPTDYTGEANKYLTVRGDEAGVEFIVASGGANTFKTKVSANDTVEDFLENKIVPGSGIAISTLNDGSDEDLEIAVSTHTHDEADISDLDHNATSLQGEPVDATTPSSGNLLSHDGGQWTPIPAGAGNIGIIGFGYSATLSGGLSLPVRMHAPWAGTITNVTATVSTAPTVSSIIVDINKNGTTIFTTQANRPTIAAGTQDDLSSVPDVTSVALNDIFTCDIDQVGVSPGAGLVIQVRVDL
jgi:hypothetical protein